MLDTDRRPASARTKTSSLHQTMPAVSWCSGTLEQESWHSESAPATMLQFDGWPTLLCHRIWSLAGATVAFLPLCFASSRAPLTVIQRAQRGCSVQVLGVTDMRAWWRSQIRGSYCTRQPPDIPAFIRGLGMHLVSDQTVRPSICLSHALRLVSHSLSLTVTVCQICLSIDR